MTRPLASKFLLARVVSLESRVVSVFEFLLEKLLGLPIA